MFLEMIGTIVHQLTEGASIDELEKAGLSAYICLKMNLYVISI